MFKIPITEDEYPQINWTVATYDVIIIDEVSSTCIVNCSVTLLTKLV